MAEGLAEAEALLPSPARGEGLDALVYGKVRGGRGC
jgi:hypothetical protein